jgi:hypothetical protein
MQFRINSGAGAVILPAAQDFNVAIRLENNEL